VGALLFVRAWDDYVAANPSYLRDAANPPPASESVGTQALLAGAILVFGYLIALVASLVRLRRTGGGWLLLRALAALAPLPILQPWLQRYFKIVVDNLCGDCTPPTGARIPDVFSFGSSVLSGAAILGTILFVVFVALSIVSFVRTHRRPANLPTR
jgi:uncharacterized membrane protein YtjA (UPF0391 family)